MSHRHNNKDLSRLRRHSLGMWVNTRYINSTRGTSSSWSPLHFLDLDGLRWQRPILVQIPTEKWGEQIWISQLSQPRLCCFLGCFQSTIVLGKTFLKMAVLVVLCCFLGCPSQRLSLERSCFWRWLSWGFLQHSMLLVFFVDLFGLWCPLWLWPRTLVSSVIVARPLVSSVTVAKRRQKVISSVTLAKDAELFFKTQTWFPL